MMLATALSYVSGLHWVSPDLDLPALLGTTVVVNTCNAIVCRLIAHNNGYPKTPATILGAVLGVWAVAITIVAPRRTPAARDMSAHVTGVPTADGSSGSPRHKDEGERSLG